MTPGDLLFIILKTPGFTHFIEQFGYIGILLWFLSFDQLTPVSEEISLLAIGYLSAHHIFNPFLAWPGFSSLTLLIFFIQKRKLIRKKENQGIFLLHWKPYCHHQKNKGTPKYYFLCCCFCDGCNHYLFCDEKEQIKKGKWINFLSIIQILPIGQIQAVFIKKCDKFYTKIFEFQLLRV